MLRRCFFLFLLTAAIAVPQQKKPKPPEIEVVEASVRREEGKINVDGKLRNVGEKPVRKPVVIFDFLDPDNKVQTTRKISTESDMLEPGEEAEFHGQTPEPPRVTSFRIRFEDGTGMYLKATKEEIRPIE